MEALTGGPWVITDAYLNVARWRPDFNPKVAKIDSVVAWVRFPDLPAPLFDKKFLLNLGNSIGKVIRLDVHTGNRARGKFSRMCVELDLTKPLIPEGNHSGSRFSILRDEAGDNQGDVRVKEKAKNSGGSVRAQKEGGTSKQTRPVRGPGLKGDRRKGSDVTENVGNGKVFQEGRMAKEGGGFTVLVDMVGKENLHPNERVGGMKTSNDMDMGHAHVDDNEEDPIESMRMSLEGGCVTPALAD
ncbi:hypothetical protein K1719_025010 [Acacia pycnantha]|nr:hypothetical protein K1719_025010 [Acacia pycnantha]